MLTAVRQCVGDRMELRLDGMAQYDMETARDLCAEIEDDNLQCLDRPLADAGPWLVGVAGAADGGAAGGASGDSRPGRRPGRRPLRGGDAGGDRRRAAWAGSRPFGPVRPWPRRPAFPRSWPSGPPWAWPPPRMLHLAAATPLLSGCNESAYHQLQDDVLAEPLAIESGMMTVPQGPGLGVDVERGKIERYGVVW